METQDEKKNRQRGMYISLGIHGVLLLLFFFLLAWREPDPPIPEYGIELNFGLDNQGTGSVQQQAPVTPTPAENENTESEPEQPVETEEQSEETPTESQEVTEESPVEEVEAQEIESPDVVEEATEESVENLSESQEEVVENQPESTTPVVENPEVNETANLGGVNQGDDPDAVGDAGDPEGEIDERALYGNPGAGGGASLDMAGWMWDYIPKPDDRSDQNGRIVFAITIDDNGEILSIRTVEKTVTPAVERIYRAEVERLAFSTTSDNTRPAATSTGRITFIIKSN